MSPLTWIFSFCLLGPIASVSSEPTCGSSHTRLLLLVDVRHDTETTIVRLKNIVSYFISKVEDGVIATLDVWLVDPFQQKTIFNITDVKSSRDLTSAFSLITISDVNANDLHIYLHSTDNLNAFSYIHGLLQERENEENLVVLMTNCMINCLFSIVIRVLSSRFVEIPIILILVLPPKLDFKTYEGSVLYSEKIDLVTDKHKFVYVNSRENFTSYNPVVLDLCRDCPAGWTRYDPTGHEFSCYFVDTLESPISWLEAHQRCASIESSLPALETQEELMFLIELLRNYGQSRSSLLNVTQKTIIVNLGLTKTSGSLNPQLFWSNLRPFNSEVNLGERRHYSERCVALSCPADEKILKGDVRWKLVNCYKNKSALRICEMKERNFLLIVGQGAKSNALNQTNPKGNDSDETPWAIKIIEIHDEKWSMFDCKDDVNMITYSSVCDGIKNCFNSRDEIYCKPLVTGDKSKMFSCVNPNGVGDRPSRLFTPSAARCNGVQDCPDNSDEKGCDGCLGRQCKDGTCLPAHWLSRDFEDCSLFIGANRTAYLNVSYPCQGQCSGLVQFPLEISFCNRNMKWVNYSEGQPFNNDLASVVEWTPKCLYLRAKDGGLTGCSNKRQLQDCERFECPEGFFKCHDSYCIPFYSVNDEVFDCPSGEDEEFDVLNFDKSSRVLMCSHQYHSYSYIHQVNMCDGVSQCPLGEDETDCPVACPPGFKCHGDAVGVSNHTSVPVIHSLDIFDIKTKFLNISGIDLSKLNETFILPNLLEVHTTNCNLVYLNVLSINGIENNVKIFTANFSFNKIVKLKNFGPLAFLKNLQFLSIAHNEHLSEIEEYSIWSPVLHTLDLSFTAISVLDLVILKELNSIRFLNLQHTKIALISFQSMKHFEILNLERTSISKEDMTKILKLVSVSSALYVDRYIYCCPKISGVGTPKHACRAPQEAISSCEDLLSDSLKRTLLWLMAGVALAGNVIVVTYRLFYDRGVFRKGYGVFVTNLSVSDFVMGVYLLIIATADVRYRGEYVLHEDAWCHGALCQAAGFLSTLSSETSTFFVFLITLDRCLVIRFPFGDHRFIKSGLVISVLSAWIIGFTTAFIPLIHPEWGLFSSNGMCLGLPLSTGSPLGWNYSFGLFICLNFLLFLFIAFGQMFIFRLVSTSQSFHMTTSQSIARRVQEINVAKQLFLVVLSNFLCWFPICILGFMSLTGHRVSPDTYSWVVVFVMPLNAAVNPMIYTIPVMYSKWRDFKRGGTTMPQRCVNKPDTLETKT